MHREKERELERGISVSTTKLYNFHSFLSVDACFTSNFTWSSIANTTDIVENEKRKKKKESLREKKFEIFMAKSSYICKMCTKRIHIYQKKKKRRKDERIVKDWEKKKYK